MFVHFQWVNFMVCELYLNTHTHTHTQTTSLLENKIMKKRKTIRKEPLKRHLRSHLLLQGIFLTQGLNPGLLHCRHILYYLSHQGSPLGGKKKSETLPWIKKVNSILNLCIPSSNIHDENLSSISPNSSWVNPT